MKLKADNKNLWYFAWIEARTRIKKLEKQVLKEHNLKIRPQVLMYISLISSFPDITHTKLLELLDVTKGTLSNMTNSLLSKNILKKGTHPKDKRKHIYSLTEKGKKINRVNDIIRAKIREVIKSKLSGDEIESVIHLLRKLRD